MDLQIHCFYTLKLFPFSMRFKTLEKNLPTKIVESSITEKSFPFLKSANQANINQK